jgi:hypothetical protein
LFLSSHKYGLGTQDPRKTHTVLDPGIKKSTGTLAMGKKMGQDQPKTHIQAKEEKKTAMISQWHRHEKGRMKRKGGSYMRDKELRHGDSKKTCHS